MAVVISGKKLAQEKRLKMKEQVTELEKNMVEDRIWLSF